MKKKSVAPESFTGEFYQHLKWHQFFSNSIKKQGTLPNSSYETSITLIATPDEYLERKLQPNLCNRENRAGRLIFPNFKFIVIKNFLFWNTAWWWHKVTSVDKWNRFESSEVNSYIYSQLIFSKSSKGHSMGEIIAF